MELKSRLGLAGISLLPDVLADMDYVIDKLRELHLTEAELGHKPVLEFVVAHNRETLDLTDNNQGYLRPFDGLGQRLQDAGIEPVVLLFNPQGTGAHMASQYIEERVLAVTFAKAAVDIVRHLGGNYVMGPLAIEHKYAGVSLPNLMVDHLKRVGEYAADRDVVLAVERLRREETNVFHTLDQVLEIIHAVNLPSVGFQEDTAHAVANEGPALLPTLKRGLDSGRLLYLHLSEYGDWGTAHNRAELQSGGIVHGQLLPIMQLLAATGYAGPVTLEVPHIAFKDALGQADPSSLSRVTPEIQNQVAYNRTETSVRSVLAAYRTLR
ncbi:MAG: sugar phosphate isomerase/epimerase family protein [archaeon]